MLEIEQLAVAVEDKGILQDINLTIRTGETHILFAVPMVGQDRPPDGNQGLSQGRYRGAPPMLNTELQRAVETSEKELM